MYFYLNIWGYKKTRILFLNYHSGKQASPSMVVNNVEATRQFLIIYLLWYIYEFFFDEDAVP